MLFKLFDTSRPTLPLILYFALGLACLTPYMSDSGDNASYIGLAESLMRGHGYVNTFYPGNPVETQYPPLFPVLLIPVIALFGHNYLLMKFIPFAFGGLGLFAMYHLLKKQAGASRAWIATLLTALNATYLLYATDILTETLYVFLSACALTAVLRLARKPCLSVLALTALLLALSFYARTAGATLILAAGLHLLLVRRFKTAIQLGAMVGLLLLPWALRSIRVENSYFYQLTEKGVAESDAQSGVILNRILHNLPRYAGKVFIDLIAGPEIARTSPYNPIKIATSLILCALFLVGFITALRTRLSLSDLYLLIYLGLFALWPYHDARFILPVLPLIFLHIHAGLALLPVSRKPAIRMRIATTGTLSLLILGLVTSTQLAYRNQTRYDTPETAHYRQACLYLRNNAPSDALVLARKPRIAALWSKRKSWWYTDGAHIPQTAAENIPIQPTHLIVTHYPISGIALSKGFDKLLAETPDRFRLLYQTEEPRVSVYEILR